ncbi:MAG: hypothetical protein CMJ20_00760 [Phycisphaeraceae bacterium]|nr:hypothetical protein [Phycisphaeraceae bacterium]|tara:strand:- start:4738 stop:5760 length:1023 start_codon:yes stop_codon:yes gene_type:complete
MASDQQILKIGLVGLGWFGTKWARLIAQTTGVELTAICSRSAERGHEIANQYDKPTVYQDYHQLVERDDLDAVCVLTEVNRHAEVTMAALACDKHVYVEKPLSTNLSDHDDIIQLAQQRARTVLVGYNNRYTPMLVELKARINRGELGQIVSIASRRNCCQSILSLPRYQGAEVPPLIIEPGIHTSDLFIWLTGSRPQRIYAHKRSISGRSVADTWMALVVMGDGTCGTMEQVWHVPQNAPMVMDRRIEVIGTKATAEIADQRGDHYVWGETIEHLNPIASVDMYGRFVWPGFSEQFSDFIDSIRNHRTPHGASPGDSRAAVELALGIVQSAQTGEVVCL